MHTAVIRSGVCGFTVSATADCEDPAHVALRIESDCPNYRKLAEALPEVDALHELFGDRSEGQIWKVCARLSPHASCPVPIGPPQVGRGGGGTSVAPNGLDRDQAEHNCVTALPEEVRASWRAPYICR